MDPEIAAQLFLLIKISIGIMLVQFAYTVWKDVYKWIN